MQQRRNCQVPALIVQIQVSSNMREHLCFTQIENLQLTDEEVMSKKGRLNINHF